MSICVHELSLGYTLKTPLFLAVRACWAHGVPIVLDLVGIGLIGLKRIVLQGNQNAWMTWSSQEKAALRGSGAGGRHGDGAGDGREGAVSGRWQFCF